MRLTAFTSNERIIPFVGWYFGQTKENRLHKLELFSCTPEKGKKHFHIWTWKKDFVVKWSHTPANAKVSSFLSFNCPNFDCLLSLNKFKELIYSWMSNMVVLSFLERGQKVDDYEMNRISNQSWLQVSCWWSLVSPTLENFLIILLGNGFLKTPPFFLVFNHRISLSFLLFIYLMGRILPPHLFARLISIWITPFPPSFPYYLSIFLIL